MDNAAIVRHAECDVDVVLWDGGNNDALFFPGGVHVVVGNPRRNGYDQKLGVSTSGPCVD